MATMKEIALRAEVSVATVSRVLRNIGYISEETKQRVLKAKEELNYIGNDSARQLRQGKTNTIGIIISDINNLFYSKTLSKIVAEMSQKECKILVSYSFEDPETERQSFMSLLAANVSAIVFTPVCTTNRDLIDLAINNKTRVIQFYRQTYKDIDALIINDELGAYEATKHLIAHGFKVPMLIDVNYEHLHNEDVEPSRSKGYLRALKEMGSDQKALIMHHPLIASFQDEVLAFLKENKPDSAICGTNIFGMELLNIKKIHPELKDVELVIFDDVDWVKYLDITAISQPISVIVDELINLLFDKKEELTGALIKVNPVLTVRS